MADATTYSALEAELYDLPELSAALVGLLSARLARYIQVDRKLQPMEVLCYLSTRDLPAVTDALASVGLRCAWGPTELAHGGQGWACFLSGGRADV